MQSFNEISAAKLRRVPTISARLKTGEIIEVGYESHEQKTKLIVWKDGKWKAVRHFESEREKLVPYSANNNLIQHKVILLPNEPIEYGTVEELYTHIKSFLHRYIDVSPVFEEIVASYVLLSWVHDEFDELPYLRFRGDPGSGKTRCLLAIGSLCYKPIIASGASTVSPVFRLLDSVRGTLVLDEGDFRLSDEKAEIIKILNNGNAKGFPVLRSELVNRQEFDPRAYHVYGPKIISTRGYFQDRALETRCLTEEMGQRPMRKDIPLNLPKGFFIEARELRDKLLLYRFRFLSEIPQGKAPAVNFEGRKLEPRMKQLLTPLLRVTPTEKTNIQILEFAENYQRELLTERGMETETQIIEVLSKIAQENAAKVSIKFLTERFIERFADDYERKITPRWIGSIVRKKLGLKTYKFHGSFVIPEKELSKIEYLTVKYGVFTGETGSEHSR
jgi:hypothetical protein